MTAYAQALYSFVGETEDELQFDAGDVIDNVVTLDEDWLQGDCHGRRGLFPSNFIEWITVVETAPAPTPTPAAKPAPAKRVARPTTLTEPEPTPPQAQAPAPVSEDEPYAIGLQDFEAQDEEELSFQANARIRLLRRIDKTWYEGECDNRVGKFPKGFVIIKRDLPAEVAPVPEVATNYSVSVVENASSLQAPQPLQQQPKPAAKPKPQPRVAAASPNSVISAATPIPMQQQPPRPQSAGVWNSNPQQSSAWQLRPPAPAAHVAAMSPTGQWQADVQQQQQQQQQQLPQMYMPPQQLQPQYSQFLSQNYSQQPQFQQFPPHQPPPQPMRPMLVRPAASQFAPPPPPALGAHLYQVQQQPQQQQYAEEYDWDPSFQASAQDDFALEFAAPIPAQNDSQAGLGVMEGSISGIPVTANPGEVIRIRKGEGDGFWFDAELIGRGNTLVPVRVFIEQAPSPSQRARYATPSNGPLPSPAVGGSGAAAVLQKKPRRAPSASAWVPAAAPKEVPILENSRVMRTPSSMTASTAAAVSTPVGQVSTGGGAAAAKTSNSELHDSSSKRFSSLKMMREKLTKRGKTANSQKDTASRNDPLVGQFVYSLYDFEGDASMSELSFGPQQQILITGRVNEDWLEGTIQGVGTGMFPQAFVQI